MGHAGCTIERLSCGMIGHQRGPWPFRLLLAGGNHAGSRAFRSIPGPDCLAQLEPHLKALLASPAAEALDLSALAAEFEKMKKHHAELYRGVKPVRSSSMPPGTSLTVSRSTSNRRSGPHEPPASLCTSTCRRLHTLARATPIHRTRLNPSARPRRRVDKAHRCALRGRS